LNLTEEEREQLQALGIPIEMVYRYEDQLAINFAWVQKEHDLFSRTYSCAKTFANQHEALRQRVPDYRPTERLGSIEDVPLPAQKPQQQLQTERFISLEYVRIMAAATGEIKPLGDAYAKEVNRLMALVLVPPRAAPPPPRDPRSMGRFEPGSPVDTSNLDAEPEAAQERVSRRKPKGEPT
jgi:hypothetical protein